jgi:hypothetical protein
MLSEARILSRLGPFSRWLGGRDGNCGPPAVNLPYVSLSNAASHPAGDDAL